MTHSLFFHRLKFLSGMLSAAIALALASRAATLPAWQPAPGEADARIDEWLFQPGEAVASPPQADAWEAVKVPFLWTSGGGRMIRPKGHAPAGWARTPKKWDDYDNGWFERTISVPAAWAGQRVWLAFDQLECDGLLWVDGGEPLFLEGPEARVDVTGRLKPGHDVTLRVWVTRWWKDIPKTMDQDPLRKDALKDAAGHSPGGLDALRRKIPAGLSGVVRFEVRPLAGEITGVFARPSVREKALFVDVDTLTAGSAASQIRVGVDDPEGKGGALPPDVTLPLKGGTTTIKIPWETPRLWELGDGYLYRLHASLLDANGHPIHQAAPVPFGFREIRVEGRDILLNGHPVHLKLAPVISPEWPALLFWEGIGFNAAQWHPNSSSWFLDKGRRSLVVPSADNPGMRAIRPDVIEHADRRGFALLMPAPNLSLIRNGILAPDATKAYGRECRLWFARLRNHPSILVWMPSMNTGSSTRENPERIGMAPEAKDRASPWYDHADKIIKDADPTRLAAQHCGAGGDIDYPNQYLNFMPLQERIEFPSLWASRPDARPWGAIEHGTPWVRNFVKWRGVPQFTEWHAVYFGDRAYAAETDDYVKMVQAALDRQGKKPGMVFRPDEFARLGSMTLHDDWETLFTRETNRAWRAWGVPGGWKQWNSDIGYGVPPELVGKTVKGGFAYTQLTEDEARATLAAPPPWANAIYRANRETMQPLLAYLGGPPERFTAKDHAFRAGESFRKTVVAVWDGNTPQHLDAAWTLEITGRVIEHGTGVISLKPGGIVKKPFTLTAPAVTARTDARLRLVVTAAGGKQIEDGMDLTFWPAEPAPKTKSVWAVYDPSGASIGWLKAHGVNAQPVRTAGDLARSRAEVLVVGREALDEGLPFDDDAVARGLRVLILEQKPAALEAVGLRIQDIVSRVTFPRDVASPVLAGLTTADLANWRGAPDLLPRTSQGMKPWPLARPPHWGNEGAVSSVVIETPQRGAFTPLIDAEFDLAYSPLLEWRHGKGGVLFSQVDLVNRPGGEPAADHLADNLIRALDAPYAQSQRKCVRYLGNDAGRDYIHALGFEDGRLADARAVASLRPADDLLVIGPDAGAALTDILKTARGFAKTGGVFLVLPQKPADLASASTPALPLKTGFVRRTHVTPEAETTEPLLRGIGPQLTHWRTFLPEDRFSGAGLPAQATLGLEGLLLDFNASPGRGVFSQLDWRPLDDGSWNLERPRWNTARLYRQLLTNLGVRSSDAMAARLFSVRQVAPLVNVPDWRIWNGAAKVDPTVRDGRYPALAKRLPIESPASGDAESAAPAGGVEKNDIGEGEINMPGLDLGSAKWTTYGPRKSSGRVYLEWVTPAELGKIGYARSYVYSSRPRDAVFAVGADYWMVFRVNGRICLDHSRTPRPANAPFAGEFRFSAPLKAGWNLLEAKVASGSGGFGFMCMVSDPGDAAFSATVQPPRGAPDKAPPAVLLAEPRTDRTGGLFYVRPLDPTDDPYHFNPW